MITKEDMNEVFHALAHETRREVLDLVRMTPGMTVGELARHFDVSRIAVMNHLAVLEKAGLLVSETEGRRRKLYLNAVPIQMIYDRWIDTYTEKWSQRVTDIKFMAEQAVRKEGQKDE